MSPRPLLIALRELRSYVADIGALGFGLALPLVLLALMIGAFGSEVQFSSTAYVVDNDGGPYAEALLDELDAIDGLSVDILDADDAAGRIDRSAILMYIEIPSDFSTRIESNEPVDLIQHQRGGGGQENQIVSSLIRDALDDITVEQELRSGIATLLERLDVDAPDEAVDAQVGHALSALNDNPPVVAETVRPDGEESADLTAILFPRIAAWMVLFAVSMSAQSFVLERKAGTLERLLTTRLTRNELFVGKWLANFVRGLFQFVVLFIIGGVVFDFFSLESWLSSVLFGTVAIAAIASLGLVIATIARTEDQATWGAVFFTMGMALLGGSFFEGGADQLFGSISKLTITYWMNTGFDSLLIDGESLAGVGVPMLVMVAIAVAGVVLSRALFRPVEGGGA